VWSCWSDGELIVSESFSTRLLTDSITLFSYLLEPDLLPGMGPLVLQPLS